LHFLGCLSALALAACISTVTNGGGGDNGGGENGDDEHRAHGGANGSGGHTSSGGAIGKGGSTGTGGGTGGRSGTGGSATSRTVSAGGTLGSGGSGNGGATSAPLFGDCRFHFCAGDWTTTAAIRSEIDYFTSGWLLGVDFNHGGVCTESASGGALDSKLPVMVSYIAADYVKHTHNLCDCNVTTCGSSGGRTNDLCNYGAQYITQDWAAILNLYKSNSDGFANCMGGRPIVFEMEPDWYQYAGSSQTQAWSAAQTGTNMTALVNAMKSNGKLKAFFSVDISPWIPDNGSGWYSNFDLSLFTFGNTSGGGTDANNVRIRSTNGMTWAGVAGAIGKPILADTGYGAAGAAAGEDANWNVAANINARMADGVVGICQYNPGDSWGSTITGVRSQLNKPRYCP
jgi:hypothetical protein